MTGTVTIVERWGAAGAPEKKLEEIRTAYDGYFEQVERFGITRANYLIAAREALIDCRPLIEGKVFSRPRSKSGKREACLARWSRILDSVRAVLSHFGRVGWTIFWSAIRKLQDVFGVNERGSWERLRILQDIGWLVVWHRWDGKEHTYEEGRSNVYFLRVPEEIWEAWTPTPKAQKLLAKLARSDDTMSDAPPSSGLRSPPVSVSPPAASSRPRPSSTRQPVSPPPSAAGAPSETVHWFPALFHALRAERYASDGGTSRHVATIEQYFEEEAAALHAKCLQQGLDEEQLLGVPAPPAIARDLATAAVGHWLRDPGKDGEMLRREHPIGCFARNARQLATAAAAAWWTEWLKANPPPPVLLAEPVVHRAPVSVSLSLAAAVPPIDQPSQRRPVLRRSPLSEREAEEWARCQAAEAAELAATESGDSEVDGDGLADDELDDLEAAEDLDGDFDTLLSAVDPVPD